MQYPGHSAHVTAVKFTHDDSRLISAGGEDCWWVSWKCFLLLFFLCRYLLEVLTVKESD